MNDWPPDEVAVGASVGTVVGVGVFVATGVLVGVKVGVGVIVAAGEFVGVKVGVGVEAYLLQPVYQSV